MSNIIVPGQAEWDDLTDDARVSKDRAAAEKAHRDLTMDQVKHLRKKAKDDLFFLAYGVLGYELMSPKLHGHLSSWLKSTRNEQYRLLLLPRGHYKSTIKTISESVQMALPNDDGIVEEHPWCLGPDIKLLLSHENRESASRFLFEIAEAFLKKPMMLALFPECIPSKRHQRINKWELELPRAAHHKEPTFDTIGAGGAAQGRHYSHIIMDDIIGEAARDSDTVMRTVLMWFDNVNSLLTRIKFDGWDLVGTRWSFKDVYSHAMDVYGVKKSRSVIRCMNPEEVDDGVVAAYLRGNIENGEPTFPEEFDMDFYTRMRKNPKVYAAQYANNPKEGGLNEFDPEWLKFYNFNYPYVYTFEGNRKSKIDIGTLDRVIMVDPSMGENDKSDESAVLVCGMDEERRIFVLECIKEIIRPPDLINLIFSLHSKWRPRLVSFESVAFSGLFGYWFKDKCEQLGKYPSVYDYKPGGKRSKLARVRGLAPYFSSGQIYIQEGMHQFRDEYEWFGVTNSDHILDALAQGPEIWTPGTTERQHRENIEAERQIIEMRSAVTGY
jgi:hypothetical protein